MDQVENKLQNEFPRKYLYLHVYSLKGTAKDLGKKDAKANDRCLVIVKALASVRAASGQHVRKNEFPAMQLAKIERTHTLL